MTLKKTLSFNEVTVGQELPELPIPITTTLITSTAIATRDFEPVHHDLKYTRSIGSPDIFMNILTTNGLCQRFIEDWAGPQAKFLDLKIKLGMPNYPGDTMTYVGSVTAKDDSDNSVEITFKGKNSMGSHVDGTARVQLPA